MNFEMSDDREANRAAGAGHARKIRADKNAPFDKRGEFVEAYHRLSPPLIQR